MEIIVILNSRAGSAPAGPKPEALRAQLAASGHRADVRTCEPPGMAEACERARRARPDAIFVGGGDGSVRTAAAALAGSGIPLGVLPLGTLNHFAKDLRIPQSWTEAVEVLATGEAVDVDLGEVNGHVFINNCSIGSYAEAVRRRDRLRAQRGWGKWTAMLRAVAGEFRRLRRLRLEISRDGEPPRALRTPMLVIGNNRYTGRVLNPTLRPNLDRGELWIYAIHAHRHLAVLRLVLQSLWRRLDDVGYLEASPARAAVVRGTTGPLVVAADGEVLELPGPLRFRIRPRALRVLVPRATASRERQRELAEDAR